MPAAAPIESPHADVPVLDLEALSELDSLGTQTGDPDLAERMLGTFFEASQGTQRNIDAALAGGHLSTALGLVHTLCGSASAIGANRLAAFCRAVHQRAAADPASLPAEWPQQLREHIGTTQQAIRKALAQRL